MSDMDKLEVILGDFSITTFSPILFSSVMANAVSRYASANELAFIVPHYQLNSLYELHHALLSVQYLGNKPKSANDFVSMFS